MPYVNQQGNFTHGVAGTGAFLNNAKFDNGGDCGWFSQDTIAYQHGGPDGWFVMLYNITTRQFQRGVTNPASPFYGVGVNSIFSGGEVWAGWANIPGIGLFASTGFHKPLAGLMGVGLGGEIAFVENYQNGGPTLVHEQDGSEWLLSNGIVYKLQLLGSQRAIWHNEQQQLKVAGLPQPMQLGPAWAPKATQVNGEWWVSYFTPSHGVVLHPFNSFWGYSIAPTGDAWQDVSVQDANTDTIKCVWSITAGEAAGHVRERLINTVTESRIDLEALRPPVIVPPVNKKLWLGFFTGRPGATGGWDTNDDPAGTAITPGNALLDVTMGLLLKRETRETVGTFITGSTVEIIEASARNTPNTAIVYWDGRSWPRYPNLPANSWLCLQAYQRANESLADFEASLLARIQDVRVQRPQQKIAIVAQCYTSNTTLASDLKAQVPVYSRLAQQANVIALLPFSGTGRATGLQDHPEARPAWDQLAASITGTPDIEVTPIVKPPKFTISQPTFPVSGDMPLAVRCVYATEAGSGPVDWIEWLYSTSGSHGPWTVAARNAGDDPDHTYRFNAVGNYWIKARGGNAVGTHETGLERKVTVNAVTPPDPIDPIDPPDPPAGDKFWLKTAHGGYLSTDGEGFLTQGNRKQAFELVDQGGGLVGLKANNKFGATENDLRVKVDRDAVGSEWEKFARVDKGQNLVALKSQRIGIGAGFISAHDDGSVKADQPHSASWETFTLEPASGNGSVVNGRLSIDGRMLRDASGAYYRPVWSSALAILTREHGAFLDWLVQTGFNGCRVFCGNLGWAGQTPAGALAHLPSFLEAATARGLRVEVTALTGTKDGGYNPRNYIQEAAAICQPFDNAILEMANEPWHPTQDGLTPEFLRSCQGSIPGEVISAYGAAEDDESDQYAGGPYVTVHLDRGRDEWNMVRRVRELENLSAKTNKPVFNNEPIKFGSQNGNPSIAFTMAVLNRGFEIPGVYHSDTGLQGAVPANDSLQQILADSYIRGSRVITAEGRLTFKNSGWADSPIKEFSGAVRVYSFLGEQNVCVALGITEPLHIETMNGWNLGPVLDEMPGVKVFELVR